MRKMIKTQGQTATLIDLSTRLDVNGPSLHMEECDWSWYFDIFGCGEDLRQELVGKETVVDDG